MTATAVLETLQRELADELIQRILPYWSSHVVDELHGGFVGYISGDNVRTEEAPRSCILNARILWTFSAAYRILRARAYLATLQRAAQYFDAHFVDPQYGGVYWMVDATGEALDDRKHVYAQSFAIYGWSEQYRATGEDRRLRQATDMFQLLERHAHDALHGGYREAFSRAWVPLEDVRLSGEDANEPRSMNTHLHVLEAFTNLARAWPDALLRARLRSLVDIFLDRIADTGTNHLRLFFSDDWMPRSSAVSYGHDIEASWLLLDAIDVLRDDALRARVQPLCLNLADAVLTEGLDAVGGVFNEVRPDGSVDTDKEWWPQAEAIVGFLNAYQKTGRSAFLDAAVETWAFTRRHILDRERGEWHRRVARDGSIRPDHEKVGPWKCPYHNARACLEVMARVETLLTSR
jgi:mannobiose 2-epimerase